MIVYCQKCKVAFDGNGNCPVCGNTKVRPVLLDDICFLTDADPILGRMIKDVLEQNGIPALSNSSIGAGMAMRAGSMFERIKYYVRYEHLLKAKEIVEELSNSPAVTE